MEEEGGGGGRLSSSYIPLMMTTHLVERLIVPAQLPLQTLLHQTTWL